VKVQEIGLRKYAVRVAAVAGGGYQVTYTSPKKESGRKASRLVEYQAELQPQKDASITWGTAPSDPEHLVELDEDARNRVMCLHPWRETLIALVKLVQTWASDLGWSTKVIEKSLEDSSIGNYTAPALLMQEETIRILIEPIARSAPGVEGVADLYVLPAYDDIASLVYSGQSWQVRYAAPGHDISSSDGATITKPLTRASFRNVLLQLKSHAE
jgi:hypothetical protein